MALIWLPPVHGPDLVTTMFWPFFRIPFLAFIGLYSCIAFIRLPPLHGLDLVTINTWPLPGYIIA
jgi:hypothetical protein